MGLDITIREHVGFTDKGYLQMRAPLFDLPYTTDRVTIRHDLHKGIAMKKLVSGKKDDWEEYYRPMDFGNAYRWADSLPEHHRNYVIGLLDSLVMSENYWLDYSS